VQHFAREPKEDIKNERTEKRSHTTGTNRIPAEGKRSNASIKADPTIPKHEFTLLATRVSTKASELDIRTFGGFFDDKDFIKWNRFNGSDLFDKNMMIIFLLRLVVCFCWFLDSLCQEQPFFVVWQATTLHITSGYYTSLLLHTQLEFNFFFFSFFF
jgi:hypothetical protein